MTQPRTAYTYNLMPDGSVVSITIKQGHPQLVGMDQQVTVPVDTLIGMVGHLLYVPRALLVGDINTARAEAAPPAPPSQLQLFP